MICSSGRSSQVILYEVPNILNFALFIQDLAGLGKCNTKLFPWQSLKSNFEKVIQSDSLVIADKEWREWWANRNYSVNP